MVANIGVQSLTAVSSTSVNRIAVFQSNGEFPRALDRYISSPYPELLLFDASRRKVICSSFSSLRSPGERTSSYREFNFETAVNIIFHRPEELMCDGAYILFPDDTQLAQALGILPKLIAKGGKVTLISDNMTLRGTFIVAAEKKDFKLIDNIPTQNAPHKGYDYLNDSSDVAIVTVARGL